MLLKSHAASGNQRLAAPLRLRTQRRPKKTLRDGAVRIGVNSEERLMD